MPVNKFEDYTLVIADDNAVNRLVMSLMLKELNRNVIEVEDGKQVMDLMKQMTGKKIILLLDLNMPVFNGYEVIRHFSNDGAALDFIRIIVVSATHVTDFDREGLNDFVSGYITKPIDRSVLLSTIQNCSTNF